MTAPERTPKCSGVVTLKESVLYYIKYMVLSYIIIVLVLLLLKILNFNVDNVNSLKNQANSYLLYNVILIVFIGPFVEETIFRLWHSFKKRQIFFSLFTVIYCGLTKVILPHNHDIFIGKIQSDYFEYPVLKIVLSLLVAASVFLLNDLRLKIIAKKYGKSLILISISIFALLHLTNIRCDWYLYPFLICMCIPQFIMGVSITNIRLNIGFVWGLLFHCAINMLTVLLSDMKLLFEVLGSL